MNLFFSVDKIISYSLLLFSVAGINIIRDQCLTYAKFHEIVTDVKGRYVVLRQFQIGSKDGCLGMCLDDINCKSVNYLRFPNAEDGNGSDRHNCELLRDDLESNPNGLLRRKGWVYIETGQEEKRVGPLCSSNLNLCPPVCQCNDACKQKGYICNCIRALQAKQNLTIEVLSFPSYGINGTNNMFISWNVIQGELSEITLCAWFKASSVHLSSLRELAILGFRPRSVLSRLTDVGSCDFFTLHIYNGHIFLTMPDHILSAKLPLTAQWNHVCISRSNGGLLSMFIDGHLRANSKLTRLEPLMQNGDIMIGNRFTSGQDDYCGEYQPSSAFVGMITDLSVWNRVLNASEVKEVRFLRSGLLRAHYEWSHFLKSGKLYGEATQSEYNQYSFLLDRANLR